jgi:uncharacterized protein
MSPSIQLPVPMRHYTLPYTSKGTDMQHPFVWHDLMTSHVEDAKTFYTEVVGWTFTKQAPDYQVAHVSGAGIGGIMAMPPAAKTMPPFWAGYIHTPDVDAACAQLGKLGGKVHREPWNIPGMLRMAIVADPTGAVFNIMQPLTHSQLQTPGQGATGTVGWHELHAGNLNEAWEFYATMFGWTKGVAMDMGKMGIYQVFQIDGQDVGGMMQKWESMPMAMWMYYFQVNGIDTAVARITNGNGKITMGPHQVPSGKWIVTALDPQGGHFCLTSDTK